MPKQNRCLFYPNSIHIQSTHRVNISHTHWGFFFLLPLDLEHNFDQGTSDQDDFIWCPAQQCPFSPIMYLKSSVKSLRLLFWQVLHRKGKYSKLKLLFTREQHKPRLKMSHFLPKDKVEPVWPHSSRRSSVWPDRPTPPGGSRYSVCS